MSEVRYSAKRARAYKRSFSYEEARRRYQKGETMAQIAQALGVSREAIGVAIRQPDVTYAKPVVKNDPRCDRHYDVCPTCQGRKTRKAEMCIGCRKDTRLTPLRAVRVRGSNRTQLGAVDFGRIVLYKDRWAVVEHYSVQSERWRELHYWDGPPERVSVKEYVTKVLPTTEYVEVGA